MKHVAGNTKKVLLAVVAVPLLLAGAWLVAAERGPYECNNGCGIDYPKPDAATLQYIEQMKPLFYRWFGDVFWNKGDIYIICNANYCAKYVITDDFGVYGTDGRVQRTGSGTGGREATGPSTGGNTGGGGCVASCGTGGGGTGTGTVIVYEPLPEKQAR